MKALCIIFAIIIGIVGIIPWVNGIVKNIQFSSACGDYLKLAADANSIDVAEKHLFTAIQYIEKHGLTSGYTKIFVYYPKNDLGLWYENLKTAQTQLQEMQKKPYTELEESNMLMKLRETLLDSDGTLTHPLGISFGDGFTVQFWLMSLLWLPCSVVFWLLLYIAEECL